MRECTELCSKYTLNRPEMNKIENCDKKTKQNFEIIRAARFFRSIFKTKKQQNSQRIITAVVGATVWRTELSANSLLSHSQEVVKAERYLRTAWWCKTAER